MTTINFELAAAILIPGEVEECAKRANNEGNTAKFGLFQGLAWSRNGLYCGIAMAALGALGRSFTSWSYTSTAFALLGLGVSLLSSKRLYDYTLIFQRMIHHEEAEASRRARQQAQRSQQ